MLFDPEAGMTVEQSIEIAWKNHISPEMRAQVLALANETGQTRNDIMLECLDVFLENLKDPVKRAAYFAKIEREETPFGKDPRLTKDGRL